MRRALVAALAACAGCSACSGGGPCGAACRRRVEVTAGAESLVFGEFTSSPNNDCPADGAPTALTVDGRQSTAPTFHFTLCLPAPTRPAISRRARPGGVVQVVSINGQLAGDCLLGVDRTGSFAGRTIQFGGYCGGGRDPAGYAIRLSGTLPGTRTCPGPVSEPVTIELGGSAAVTAQE
jgi:hypothetical protein